MPLSDRENYLRHARFQRPEWMPVNIGISSASRQQLGPEVEDVMARHPTLFPGFKRGEWDYGRNDFGPAYTAGQRYTDAWGCVWDNAISGLEGVVAEHPLADWDAFDLYVAPDAEHQLDRGPVDWTATEKALTAAREAGHLTSGGVAHGFLFMRLTYLRGFEALLMDIADDDPRLSKLAGLVNAHNKAIVDRYLKIGVDMLSFGEDLGTQTASIVSPAQFAKWFGPRYRDLMLPCRAAGALVYLHSDGYVMELMDEFVRAGVEIVNPQDLCNGIGDLEREVKGKMAISLDVDRQRIVPFGTRQEIMELLEEEVRRLGSPEGGLSLVCGIYPPTPPENVDAVCCAMEKLRTYWSE